MKRWIAPTFPPRLLLGITALITIASAGLASATPPGDSAPTVRNAERHALRKARAARSPVRALAATPTARVRATAASTRGASGMKVAIDPATGRLVRPSAEQVRALDAQSGVRLADPDDDPARGIPIIQLANGAELARLDERFQEFEVVRVGPDGKLVRECVHGPAAAASFRRDAREAAPAPPKEMQ